MLKIFFGLDQEEHESNLIAEASNRLDVGEFQVFQLGYEAWYGKEADIKYLEKCFFAYLLENETPPWARHYARRIIALDDKGELEGYASEYHRFDPEHGPPDSRVIGAVKACTILLICLAFISYISILSYGGMS